VRPTLVASALSIVGALAIAACGSGHISNVTDAHAAAAAASASPAAPAWCARAREELDTTDKLVDRSLVPGTETAVLGEIAQRLAHERTRLDALSVGAGPATSALGYAASAANEASALVFLLESRKLDSVSDEVPAIERALYVAVRHRRRAAYVVRGHCERPKGGEPNAAFVAAAEAGFAGVPARIEPCRELARAAAGEAPITLTMLVHIDATGRPWLVAPATLEIEPGKYAQTDALECVTRRLEETTFPAPGAEVTVSIPIEIGVAR
jgi:hypothetical protein